MTKQDERAGEIFTPEEFMEHLNKIDDELQRLKRIMDPYNLEDPAKWNLPALLHIMKRLTSELYTKYYDSVREAKWKPKYWQRMASKDRDKILAAARGKDIVNGEVQ